MKVYVNDEPHEFGGKTVADLVKELGLPENGVAVACNMNIIPRVDWDTEVLVEEQRLLIIKAASGG